MNLNSNSAGLRGASVHASRFCAASLATKAAAISPMLFNGNGSSSLSGTAALSFITPAWRNSARRIRISGRRAFLFPILAVGN